MGTAASYIGGIAGPLSKKMTFAQFENENDKKKTTKILMEIWLDSA